MKKNDHIDWLTVLLAIYMPSIFSIRREWIYALVWMLVLGMLFLCIPVFIKYRKKIKGLLLFIFFVNTISTMVGIIVSFHQDFLVAGAFIWMVLSFMASRPIANQVKKMNQLNGELKGSASQ